MPTAMDALMDPRAHQEAIAAARALPAGHLAELCEVTKREAEKATERQRENWQRWWDLWQNEVEFEGKEDWQSQLWLPKPFAAVEQAASLVQRALLDSPEFFGVSGEEGQDKIIAAHVVKPLLTRILGNANFVAKYADACKVGWITGVAGYLKLRWATAQIPMLAGASIDPATGAILPAFAFKNASMLAIDYVLPWRIFRDPDSQPREPFSGTYLWHSEFRDRAALLRMAGRGWDREAIGRLLSGTRDIQTDTTLTTSQQRDAERKQQAWERHKFRRSYAVDEGWLDILDQNGDVVLPNALMVHAHGEILLPPTDNPIWATDLNTGRRKTPFIAGAPIQHPTRFEGRGLLEADEGLSLMLSHTLNLTTDAMNWVVNPDTEVYQPGLVNWDDLAEYPGKQWLTNVKEPVVRRAQRGEIDLGKVLAFLNYLDQQRQNVNFVTDFVVGLPGARADITKGEVQIKTAQSQGIFDTMGRNLELAGRQAVELAWNLVVQYMGGNDYTDPSIARILGPHRANLLATMRLDERVRALQGNLDFTFTGVTQALQKADQLQKVMQFATLAATPAYAGRTNPTQILRLIAELLGVMDRIDVYDVAPAAPMGPAAMPMAGAGRMMAALNADGAARTEMPSGVPGP